MAFGKSTASSNKTIILCDHCGDQYTSLTNGLCSKCKTPEKRAKLDAENAEIFGASKLEFHCQYCAREKRREADRNQSK